MIDSMRNTFIIYPLLMFIWEDFIANVVVVPERDCFRRKYMSEQANKIIDFISNEKEAKLKLGRNYK